MSVGIGLGIGTLFRHCKGVEPIVLDPFPFSVSLNDDGGEVDGAGFDGQTNQNNSIISDGFELNVPGFANSV